VYDAYRNALSNKASIFSLSKHAKNSSGYKGYKKLYSKNPTTAKIAFDTRSLLIRMAPNCMADGE
jgi:hypothetical protein